MNKAKVISIAGLTVNLAQVKSFHLSNFSSIGKRNTLIVEFKTRHEYIYNPGTKEYEKQEYNDVSEVQFPDWETAREYVKAWEDNWQDYLNEQDA